MCVIEHHHSIHAHDSKSAAWTPFYPLIASIGIVAYSTKNIKAINHGGMELMSNVDNLFWASMAMKSTTSKGITLIEPKCSGELLSHNATNCKVFTQLRVFQKKSNGMKQNFSIWMKKHPQIWHWRFRYQNFLRHSTSTSTLALSNLEKVKHQTAI